MKNRYRLNALTSLIAAMFVLSLFSGIAAAETPKDKYENLNGQYQILKDVSESPLKERCVPRAGPPDCFRSPSLRRETHTKTSSHFDRASKPR